MSIESGVARMKQVIGLIAGCALTGVAVASHDDTLDARFVDSDGANATTASSTDPAAASSTRLKCGAGQHHQGRGRHLRRERRRARELPVRRESTPKAATSGGHFEVQDPDAYPTILVGVDPRYRQAMMHLGFKWAADLAMPQRGIVDDSPAPALQATAIAPMPCVQGSAGQFPCRNVDFLAQISLNQFTSQPASAANVWGFVDLNDDREYAVVGLSNGTAVVDVTDPGRSARRSSRSREHFLDWREVKIYQHFDAAGNRYRAYAYVTTEAPQLRPAGASICRACRTRDARDDPVGHGFAAHGLHIEHRLRDQHGVAGRDGIPVPRRQQCRGRLPGASTASRILRSRSSSRQAPAGTQYMHDSTSLLITDQRTTQCALGHDPCEVWSIST